MSDTITFNPKDWPEGSNAIVAIPEQSEFADVLITKWSPSAKYVRVQVEPFGALLSRRIWIENATDWQLIERLPGTFGR